MHWRRVVTSRQLLKQARYEIARDRGRLGGLLQDREPRSGAGGESGRWAPLAPRGQHHAVAVDLDAQRIAGDEAELPPDGTGQNDLTLTRQAGLHGKTSYPSAGARQRAGTDDSQGVRLGEYFILGVRRLDRSWSSPSARCGRSGRMEGNLGPRRRLL